MQNLEANFRMGHSTLIPGKRSALCWILSLLAPAINALGHESAAYPVGHPEGEGLAAEQNAGSSDGIAGTIHGRNRIFRRRDSRVLLPRLITDSLETGLKKSTEWLGIESAFTYDALAMGVVSNHADRGAMAGDATLSLHWQINDKDGPRPLEIAARIRDRETLGGGLAPSELRAATGSIWGYVHGYTDAGWEIPDFYLQQLFFDKKLLVRYGQMSIDDLLDDYHMRSAKSSFLNEAFSYSPAVGLPGSGLGVLTRWTSPGGWDLTLAASNVGSTSLNDEAEWNFKTDALFGAAQLGYRFEGIAQFPGRLQLLLWNADALPVFNVAAGRGASFTLEQEWPDKWHSWVRCAWSDGEAAKATRLISAGISRRVGKNGGDLLGLAIAAGESSRDSSHWQETLEVFYRWEAGPLRITPDIQLNTGENIGGDSNWILVTGLRVGFTF